MKKAFYTLLLSGISVALSQAATYTWNGSSWTSDGMPGSDKYLVDASYNSTAIITSIPALATIDFGSSGQILGGSNNGFELNGKKFTLSGTLDTQLVVGSTEAGSAQAGDYVIVTRVLIGGSDLWYRDGTNGPDFDSSSTMFSSTMGDVVLSYEGLFTGNTYYSGYSTGLTATAADYGKFVFVSTKYEDTTYYPGVSPGIAIQYVAKVVDPMNIPEPATATLGLISLGGLLLRRRR